jgi:hypothetical protein
MPGFHAAGHAVVKERVNAISLPTVKDIRRDSDLFPEGKRTNEFQELTQDAMNAVFELWNAEMDLASMGTRTSTTITQARRTTQRKANLKPLSSGSVNGMRNGGEVCWASLTTGSGSKAHH